MTEVTINRLGLKGDGIADGPIYARLTLPGEVVTGDLQGSQLLNPKIKVPSPDRIAPVCAHFRSCGGCQLQHASDEFVANWKQEIVRSALETQGLTTEFLPIHISSAQSRRRAVLTARRTKKSAMVGFHARASDVIVEIPGCTLLHPDLIAAQSVIAALAQVGASRKQPLAATLTQSTGGLDISVRNGKPLDGALQISLANLANAHDLARLTWEDEVIVTRRAPVQRFGKAEVVPPPGAFLQATVEAEQAMRNDVADIVGDSRFIADLFAGSGTFALALAERCEVHAVEGDAAMMHSLDQAWRKTEGLHKVTHEARDLFRRPLEPDELADFGAVVIDPPRAGAQAQVDRLAQSGVSKIAYVSCNPVSFSKDAKRLTDAGFVLKRLRVFDQFRWSAHVELVAEFTR